MASNFAAMRAALRDDAHRPRYHFTAPANWMNDPNGLIQWQGVHHLFYQYNPDSPLHGNIHWGHAASADLVHWEDWPVALAPTPDSPDADGVYSGCAVDDNGVPTLIYSGNRRVPGTDLRVQRTCVATSADGLRTWVKDPGNPVIPETPPGLDLVQYRDPSVWREGDTWHQVTGSGFPGVGGTALVYRSSDLRHWEYLHPLCVGDVRRREPIWTGTMWECPQFFPLDDTYVLLISAWDRGTKTTPYLTGAYADHRLAPRAEGLLDLGWSFYAPQSFRDDRGRRVMFGWLREERPTADLVVAGWAGAMSVPRILSARPDGTLDYAPAPELEALRGEHVRLADRAITPDSRDLLGDLRGNCMEIVAEFTGGDTATFGLIVARSPDGAEETRIVYDCARSQLTVDRTRSSTAVTPERPVVGGACPLDAGGTLRLHIFLDGSIVEIFANGRACLTARIYPSQTASVGIDLFARGGDAHLSRFDCWTMASIWDEHTPITGWTRAELGA